MHVTGLTVDFKQTLYEYFITQYELTWTALYCNIANKDGYQSNSLYTREHPTK